jgi:hypothetical protein
LDGKNRYFSQTKKLRMVYLREDVPVGNGLLRVLDSHPSLSQWVPRDLTKGSSSMCGLTKSLSSSSTGSDGSVTPGAAMGKKSQISWENPWKTYADGEASGVENHVCSQSSYSFVIPSTGSTLGQCVFVARCGYGFGATWTSEKICRSPRFFY